MPVKVMNKPKFEPITLEVVIDDENTYMQLLALKRASVDGGHSLGYSFYNEDGFDKAEEVFVDILEAL